MNRTIATLQMEHRIFFSGWQQGCKLSTKNPFKKYYCQVICKVVQSVVLQTKQELKTVEFTKLKTKPPNKVRPQNI